MRRAGLILAAGLLAAVAVGQDKADAPEVTVASMPPVIVKTVPQAGDTEVDPGLKEIRVTFSKDMKIKGMWAWCQISRDTYPERAGDIHYLDDQRTCVMPVKLEPGKTYVIWLNQGRFNTFRDKDNHPAVPYLLVFQTKKEAGKGD